MKISRRAAVGAAVVAGAVLIGAALKLLTRPPSFEQLRQGRKFDVILVTLDTTRADRLACYGCPDVQTPTIDGFAARGVKFERCYSQTPLTLPSHTTIMTGTLPLFHGVRDNGGFIVPPGIKTLAELFKDKGYDTAAFVAAYVLDSKWGLNKGFDYYFDQFNLAKFKRISLGTVQRPANEVIDAVLPWLESKKDKPFFTWIHLYDPHSPYEPPPPYDRLYAAHPYLGEIAFADSQLRRVWDFLETHKLADNTLLVFAADHGESLGEHEEQSHGFFVYQGTVHVPLIIVTPFARFRGLSSPQVVSLADIMPTVCEMAGLPIPPEVQGRTLLPIFYGRTRRGAPLAYSETYYPRFHYGWSELVSVQNERYKLILAPVPELYDVVQDPREEKNLVYVQKSVYEDLTAQAESFIRSSGRNAYQTDYSKIDEESREKLAALGYIGSFQDPAKFKGRRLANPREKIGIFNELSRAREMGLGDEPDKAIAIIRGIIASDPDIVDAYFSMGNIYFQHLKYAEALASFRQVLDRKPDDSFAAINIALSYEGLGKFDEAESFVLEFLKKGVKEPQLYFLLANMNFFQKKYDKALSYFENCVSLNAESAASHNIMGAIYILKGDLDKADDHLRHALQINPKQTNLHYNMAQVAEKRGRPVEAEAEYLKEIENSPKHIKATYNLARLYRLSGRQDKEYENLQRCVEIDPQFPLSYFYIARIYLNRGERFQEAVDLVKKAIDLKPEKAELPLGYFLLADLYNRLGNEPLSREYAQKGKELADSLKGEKPGD